MFLVVILLNTFLLFCDTYKYYNGIGYNHRMPKSYAITCPKCLEYRDKTGAGGGIATRHRHQYVTDEKTGNKYIEYICDHGHIILICYAGPDLQIKD